jgi:hypothetical protein
VQSTAEVRARQAQFSGDWPRAKILRRVGAVETVLREAYDAEILTEVEALTRDFRFKIAAQHRRVVIESREDYQHYQAAGAWALANAADRKGEWHRRRAKGQRQRFARVRECATRVLLAQCRECGDVRDPIVETCDVRRACRRCADLAGLRNRARFGRARGRLYEEAERRGLYYPRRRGGAWSEKMLTLTAPHWSRTAPLTLPGVVDTRPPGKHDHHPTDVEARVAALFEAWTHFNRRWREHWKAAFEGMKNPPRVVVHRNFEWTPGDDGQGHPHFHVWLFCPWVPAVLVSQWWADSLRAAGVPLPEGEIARVKIQRFESLDGREVRELMKGRGREALRLSRLVRKGAAEGGSLEHAPANAVDYCAGWSAPESLEGCPASVHAALYRAIEPHRMTQASRGFFEGEEDAECSECGSTRCFQIQFVDEQAIDIAEAKRERRAIIAAERGPP